MVAFQACGGLGNQLFQYAFARSLAELHGTVAVADPSWYLFAQSCTKREFELVKYPVVARLPTQAEMNGFLQMLSQPADAVPPSTPFALVREKAGYLFDPSVFERSENSYFVGYWQSPKYFERIRSKLLVELSPVSAMSLADQEMADQILNSNSVAIHIRRGDYITWPAAANFHGSCSIDYYRRAFDVLCDRIGQPKLFVFSDDIAWARENLNFGAQTIYVDHNGPEDACQDLRLMSMCRHFIIANSTFSWWAAWLGNYAGKLVCAPNRWYAHDPQPEDLIPEDWIRL